MNESTVIIYLYADVIDTQIAGDVKNVSVGNEVFGFQWSDSRPHELEENPLVCGSFAQYILIDASKLCLKPRAMSFNVAATLGVVGSTAYQCLFDHGRVTSGSKVLILGGSSAVGILAVQFAKLKGAHVVTTCSSRALGVVSTLGADKTIDYTVNKWDEDAQVKEFDVVFDTVGEKDGLARAVKSHALKSDGVFVSIADFSIGYNPAGHPPLSFAAAIACKNKTQQLNEVVQWIADGSVKVIMDDSFPFTTAGVVAAMDKIESGKSIGKNVIRISHP